jgi:hypothetical protein
MQIHSNSLLREYLSGIFTRCERLTNCGLICVALGGCPTGVLACSVGDMTQVLLKERPTLDSYAS